MVGIEVGWATDSVCPRVSVLLRLREMERTPEGAVREGDRGLLRVVDLVLRCRRPGRGEAATKLGERYGDPSGWPRDSTRPQQQPSHAIGSWVHGREGQISSLYPGMLQDQGENQLIFFLGPSKS